MPVGESALPHPQPVELGQAGDDAHGHLRQPDTVES